MTPEVCEEAAEFNLTKGEKNSQSHKTTKLKASASTKRDSNGHPLKGIEACLPEPQYRTVAGHVSRRANTSVAADPPPPPAPSQATSSDQQRKRRKKTDGGGLGDDSDDSDSGDRKPGQGNDTSGTSSRRRRPRAQNDHEPTSADVSSRSFASLQLNPIHFSKEEQKRLARRRELRAMSSLCENLSRARIQNLESAVPRQVMMVAHLERKDGPGFWAETKRFMDSNGALLKAMDEKLNAYLEHSLHWAAIEGITDNAGPVMKASKQFIHELEQEIIRQCVKGNLKDPLAPEETMEMALQRIDEDIALLPESMSPGLYYEQYFSPDGFGSNNTAQGVFAKAFIRKMIKSAVRERDQALRDAPSINVKDEESARLILSRRTHSYGPTNAYMEWLCQDIDLESIESCPAQLQEGLRAMQRLKSLREGTQQFFACQDDVYGSDIQRGGTYPCVSLFMLKGDQLLRSQVVAHSELLDLGWCYPPGSQCYWRYSIRESSTVGGQRPKKAVFKVDMHGAVLGVWNSVWFDCQSNGEWIDGIESQDS